MSTQTHEADLYSRTDLEDMASEDSVLLNLGCGTDDTGIGIDINYDPDIRHNLNDGIPVADAAVDEIVAHHLLEHVENPTQLLAESHRVLRPDGEIHIEIPNAGWLPVRLWITQDLHRFWQHKTPGKTGHWLARRLGNPDERRTPHLSLFSRTLLAEHLERAGFYYEIEGSHLSRNLTATAWPAERTTDGRTLHELERASGDDLASGDYWAQTRAAIMNDWVSDLSPESVLDVGCGSGYLTANIAAAHPTATVKGVDINADSIKVARCRDTSAEFHVADAFDLSYAPGSFDCIIIGDVLEHFEEPERVLTAVRDLLTPNGRIIVSVPAFRFLYGPHDRHNDHADRYTRRRLAGVANSAGFDLDRSRYTNAIPLLPYFVYQRILRRPVPNSMRGGHRTPVELAKRLLIRFESAVRLPIGVTLLAQLRPVDDA